MKLINRISIVIGIFMLCLIVGNILMLSAMKTALENGSDVQDWMSLAVAASLIVVGVAHLFAILNLFKQFWHFRNDSFMRAATVVIGFFSLFLLAVEVMMLSDIGHEYMVGHDISGEWKMVFAGHAIHVLFVVLILIQCAATGRMLSMHTKTTVAMKDEALFLTVNQIGIISAILGFICLFLPGWFGVPKIYLNSLLFLLCVVLLIPYGLAAGCWFFSKRKEKPEDWYDEKQFSDISRGALFTLLLNVFITIIFYFLLYLRIIDINIQFWLSEYLFLTLLFFSSSSLYMSKRA